MAMQRLDKRSRLVSSAMRLFHEGGYDRTSIARIAAEAGVQLGNVYYYFKTKDEIGAAVVQYLSAKNRAMQELWDAREPDPGARLSALIQMYLDNVQGLVHHGCPIAGLCSELRKAKSKVLAEQAASIYGDIQTWLEEQFGLLGRKSDAEQLAAHLLCAVQGSILVSHVFRDTSYLERELHRLQGWLRSL
jgi:AcrR family transcriptional regulator